MLNIQDKYGEQIRKHFSSHINTSHTINRGFAISKEIPADSILFIGLNPSFTFNNEPEKPEEIFYSLKSSGNYRYFKRFEEIAENTKLNWAHLDLLAIRETNQNVIADLLKHDKGISFIWNHLLITKDILENCNPKIIVVANSLARTFLGKDVDSNNKNKWLGYDFDFDNKIGTYKIKNNDSKLSEKPVFFTSMLTGQRALDNGSYERLNWHIKYVLESI